MSFRYLLLSFICISTFAAAQSDTVYLRVNQLGYLPREAKVAILFSHSPIGDPVTVYRASDGESIATYAPHLSEAPVWEPFPYYYEVDFSSIEQTGNYYLALPNGRSAIFHIGDESYRAYQEDLLLFMRQQRCGYNPYLDMVCHQGDGRSMYGPIPDSTFVDLSGGWHDAGDQLKYLITGSYATAHMLTAYELYPERFADRVNALGQPLPNGLPDVLDEAKWGLDWILKMHPAPRQLFHQVADDRDHIGWKMPDEDRSDYGWGPDSYRVAYFATGSPQGLREHQSRATGLANLAGRSAAALALAARIWSVNAYDTLFAARCLAAARSLYQMGKEQEGYQQGNSYGAPYRYNEDTWADDMEWGAAELYKVTGEGSYLSDAKNYARMAGTVSWMPLDTADHYRYYPFVNMGHFALYDIVDAGFKDTLAAYYRDGIQHAVRRGINNPYRIGVPFIWCSNNLLTALITQILLYERMTGDQQFHDFLIAQRDWLFGRNPWGTSMFTGIPADGEYPLDVHTSVWALTREMVPGGLVDGPVYASIYNTLRGLTLLQADEFEPVQTNYVVYHDDIGDYSTNEPTMDGTAGAILMMAHWGR